MLYIEIINPEKKIFEGDVYGIIIPATDGYLEILTGHAPLVGALKQGQIAILKQSDDTAEQNQKISVSSGFFKVVGNKVRVIVS